LLLLLLLGGWMILLQFYQQGFYKKIGHMNITQINLLLSVSSAPWTKVQCKRHWQQCLPLYFRTCKNSAMKS
jgi:hypothetical protein